MLEWVGYIRAGDSMLFALFFFLSLPALAALGFDLYLAYGETFDFSKPLELSSVGWLWLTYSEETFRTFKQSVDPGLWETFIKPVMSLKTVVAALFPIYIALPIVLLRKTFGWGPYQGNGWIKLGKSRGPKGFAYKADLGDTPRKQAKYNRR